MAVKNNVTAHEIKIALAKRNSDDYFLTEVKTGATTMARKGELKIFDGLAIKKSWSEPCITGFEVKVSRNDFLGDEKWPAYLPYCHRFYFVCPAGLIQKQELPNDVGLIYFNPDNKSLRTVRKATYRLISINPDLLLYIIYSRLDPERIPFYSSKEEYYKDWLANKIDSRELGWNVRNKTAKTLMEQAQEIDRLKKRIERQDELADECEKELRAIKTVLTDNGIKLYGYGTNYIKELDKRLKCDVPPQTNQFLDTIISTCEKLKGSFAQQ